MQGAEAVTSAAVEIGASVAQQLNNVCMAAIACHMDRTHAVTV
jgi:hypothetical protein